MVSARRTLVLFGFARARFGLVFPDVSLVPVFSTTTRPLSMMFRHVPRLVPSFSRSRCGPKFLCARALAVLLALVE